MSNDQIIALMTIIGSLILVSRSYIAHRVPINRTIWMALAWCVAIGAVTWLFQFIGAA